jgi:hypothetical protein
MLRKSENRSRSGLLIEPDSRYGAQLISTLHHLNKKVYRKECAVVLVSDRDLTPFALTPFALRDPVRFAIAASNSF